MKNTVKWLGTLAILILVLTACKFPLLATNNNVNQDLQSTLSALQLTASALQEGTTNQGGTINPPEADVPTAETVQQITHLITPVSPPGNRESGMTDSDTSSHANERKSVAGENFSEGLLERPFNADTMDKYFPDLDILEGTFNRAESWIFIQIRLQGTQPDGSLQGSYGTEFDLNVDGRGDVLVFVQKPGGEWSVNGVQVWQDLNGNVGARIPVQADQPQNGDGYETNLFNSGVGSDPDAAWARVNPSNPRVVQIAFKSSLINNDEAYMWGAWAQTEFHPDWFDYNDHFTISEAGSPLTYQIPGYPLKALAEVDNTCRWAVGFAPTGNEPGICKVAPTPVPPSVSPGTIKGLVWNDINTDKGKDIPPEFGLSGAVVRLRKGSCGSPGELVGTKTTNAEGNYSFNSVDAGTYCVDVSTPPVGYTKVPGTGPKTITIESGGSGTANFPYYIYIG